MAKLKKQLRNNDVEDSADNEEIKAWQEQIRKQVQAMSPKQLSAVRAELLASVRKRRATE